MIPLLATEQRARPNRLVLRQDLQNPAALSARAAFHCDQRPPDVASRRHKRSQISSNGRLSGSSPERSGAVDVHDWLVDLVLGSEVLHCLAARRIRAVVVHDAVPAERQPGIEVFEALYGGLVQVPVEPYKGPCVPCEGRQRLLEPALDEANVVIEEPVSPEIGLNIFSTDGQPDLVVKVAEPVQRIPGRIGFRNAREGVGEPHLLVTHPMGSQDPPHEDCAASAPHPGLDEVSGNLVFDNSFDTVADVVKALQADHRLARKRHPPVVEAFRYERWRNVDPAGQFVALEGQ